MDSIDREKKEQTAMTTATVIKAKAIRGILAQKGYSATIRDGFITVDNTNFGIDLDLSDGWMELLTNYNRDGKWNCLRNAYAYNNIDDVVNAVISKIKWAEQQQKV